MGEGLIEMMVPNVASRFQEISMFPFCNSYVYLEIPSRLVLTSINYPLPITSAMGLNVSTSTSFIKYVYLFSLDVVIHLSLLVNGHAGGLRWGLCDML